jgi:hypothetical protein
MATPVITEPLNIRNSLAMDEKHVAIAESEQSDVSSPHSDWTEEEERILVRKIDLIVMPLLMLAFFALQLDHGNM